MPGPLVRYGVSRILKTSLLAFVTLMLVFGATACSSSGTASGGPARASRNPNLVTAAELAESTQINLFDALRRLRPAWLRVRGSGTVRSNQETFIQVYIDNVLRGSSALLARIRTSSVSEIRYMDPNDASLRYGSSHRDGAIMITLR